MHNTYICLCDIQSKNIIELRIVDSIDFKIYSDYFSHN